MPDKEYNQEEQEYLIHRQELKYLMDKYPEDFKDWNDEEEPYSFFDVLKDTAKMGGMAGIIGLEKIGVNTGPIIQKARKYFNEGGIVEEESFWDKFNPLTGSYRKETPISVKAAEVVAENAPITGSAYTAADISDELDKEDPSKLKIAGLMGAEVLGAVPFVGDAAQSLIRKGLKAKGYGEASDETVGLMREKYPNMQAREETYRIAERPDPKTGETDIKVGPEQELEEVPTYPEAPEKSSVFIDPSRARVEYDGEYRNTVIPTKGALYIEDIVEQSDGVLYRGMSAEEYRGALEQGYIKSKGDYNIGDEQEGLTFFSTSPSQAESYANNYTPEGFKATPDRPAYVVAIKKPNKIDYVTGDTEIGLKGEIPTSAIVDVFEGKPYQFKSDVVVQTDFGNTKNVYGSPDTALVTWERIDNSSPDDPAFRINQKDENSPTFALGGLAIARKGITTEEGKEMADKRFQLDEKKADLNNDNKLSDYEKQRGETVQKAMKMYHGGMPCGCEGGDDCDCGGGMMSDPVSGNPIPIGSSAENVRDDIEAMISEGEYVLPANVVKWHGLKHIMDMQSEAEMGLMGMYDMGLIQYAGEEAEDPEQESEAEEDVPSEDVEVEVATVEVDDMLDDEEDGEISPTTSNLPGMVSKPKLMIMS